MRDTTKLHPELQEKLQQLIIACTAQKLKIGISECVRTVAEQNALYAKGRTAAGKIVTNAKGTTYSSMHQWSVAVDFYRNDGKGAYIDTDSFFTKVGKIGQSIGLEWGGDWKSIKDKPHFQLKQFGSTASKLRSTYKTPEEFIKTWTGKPNTGSSVAESDMDVSKQVIKVVQGWLSEYTGARLLIDGAYGKNSRIAMIKAIQKTIGMPMSGTATDALFNKIIPVRQGSNGNLVKCLEGLLFVHGFNPQDFGGNCTDVVANVIEQVQFKKALKTDKIAGKDTFKALLV